MERSLLMTKKIFAFIMSVLILLPLCSCGGGKTSVEVSASEANNYLTNFFSDYGAMKNYLAEPDIAVSAFALDGAGLSALLRAYYQAQSVTYAFTFPVESAENIYTSTVTVVSPDAKTLFTMYNIDREIAQMDGEELDADFVARSFYANIQECTAPSVTTTVTVTAVYSEETGWSLLPNNDLAFAIFPNIQNA